MQADFLTITSMDAVLYGEAVQLLGSDLWHKNMFGAVGWYDGSLFVGKFSDGRFIASCAGSRSHDLLRVLSLTDFDASVARLDLQVTLVVPSADGVIRSIQPHPRYKSLIMHPVNDGDKGATLYIGAPRSRKRLRVYNKSAQSGVLPPTGEYLRVELQARDSEADYYYSLFRAGGEKTAYAGFRNVALVMAPGLYAVLPKADSPHIDIKEPPKATPYRYWLEHSVIPGIAKAMLLGDDEVLELLRTLREQLSTI